MSQSIRERAERDYYAIDPSALPADSSEEESARTPWTAYLMVPIPTALTVWFVLRAGGGIGDVFIVLLAVIAAYVAGRQSAREE